MNKYPIIAPVYVEGDYYFFVDQFASLTGKKEAAVRMLITKGNTIRKLKSISFGGKPLILAKELEDFPFVVSGRSPEGKIRFEKFKLTKEGLIKTEYIIEK